MVRTVRRMMVICIALATIGAALAGPAHADQRAAGPETATAKSATRTSSVTTIASDMAALSTSCRTLRDLSPWTYLSASCTRSSLFPSKAYSAWLTCWDVSAQVSYTAVGGTYTAPWTSYGPWSTARCDSGDYATSGTVHIT
jgi:hypothetical protein